MKFDYNDFILNGFYKTKYDDVNNIPISYVSFDVTEGNGVFYPSFISLEVKTSMERFKQQLRGILMSTFPSVHFVPRATPHLATNKYGMWGGTEPTTTVWHNDYGEGGTMFALLYFDSMAPDGSEGGSLYVTNNDGNFDCHAPRNNTIHQIVPQRGDVVFITHDRNIDHKADYTTAAARRVVSIGLNCSFLGD